MIEAVECIALLHLGFGNGSNWYGSVDHRFRPLNNILKEIERTHGHSPTVLVVIVGLFCVDGSSIDRGQRSYRYERSGRPFNLSLEALATREKVQSGSICAIHDGFGRTARCDCHIPLSLFQQNRYALRDYANSRGFIG